MKSTLSLPSCLGHLFITAVQSLLEPALGVLLSSEARTVILLHVLESKWQGGEVAGWRGGRALTCKRGLNNVSLQETGVIQKYSVLELLELGKTFIHTVKKSVTAWLLML